MEELPRLSADDGAVRAWHPTLGAMWLLPDRDAGGEEPALLFCDNESNAERLWDASNRSAYPKDAFHDHVVGGRRDAVNPGAVGTKAGVLYRLALAAGEERVLRLRLCADRAQHPFGGFEATMAARRAEADGFYAPLLARGADAELARVQRHAYAGMLWNKQFYFYDVPRWLAGDPGQPAPPPERRYGRNHEWFHLNNADVISMPDCWEYPWYAAWDTAFHCLPLARLDPAFAKQQLVLLVREWYMHPNGQLPAYEWQLGDVNPLVHAWAAWRVFEIDREATGRPDHDFLERVFHKLLLHFTWWVNRRDVAGRNVFQGGFLGLDNIGVFDRSSELPGGGRLDQADATGWMAMYCLDLLRIALELARTKPVYQDVATKFFEHFLYVAAALTDLGGRGVPLRSEEDQFFYDVLHLPDERVLPLRVRSVVGLVPLLAVEILDAEHLRQVPEFARRLEWFLEYRPDLAGLVSRWTEPGSSDRRLLSLVRRHRLKRVLERLLDEEEFLSPYGVRALSRWHREHPYVLQLGAHELTLGNEPGESASGLFPGNSNWRGPVWFPINYLLIEALRRFHAYYGEDFVVECPTGSGRAMNLGEVATELSRRLVALFCRVRTASARRSIRMRSSRAILASATCRCSSSTSTATPVAASALRTRPAGPAWLPSSRATWRDSWAPSRYERAIAARARCVHHDPGAQAAQATAPQPVRRRRPMLIRVGQPEDVAAGRMRVFEVAGTKVNVANTGGRLYAFDDTCTHTGCSLAMGELDGTTVTCACHGSQFDVTTGAVLAGPARRPVRSHLVQVEAGDLLVDA